jgi:hypothetical protein
VNERVVNGAGKRESVRENTHSTDSDVDCHDNSSEHTRARHVICYAGMQEPAMSTGKRKRGCGSSSAFKQACSFAGRVVQATQHACGTPRQTLGNAGISQLVLEFSSKVAERLSTVPVDSACRALLGDIPSAEALESARSYNMDCTVTTYDIEVRPSSIHGRGAFAGEPIPANRCIGMYQGVSLTSDQFDVLESSSEASDYVLQVGRNHYLDAREENKSNWTRFINDPRGSGRKPNCVFTQGGCVKTVLALHLDEELLVTYGDEFWDNGVE